MEDGTWLARYQLLLHHHHYHLSFSLSPFLCASAHSHPSPFLTEQTYRWFQLLQPFTRAKHIRVSVYLDPHNYHGLNGTKTRFCLIDGERQQRGDPSEPPIHWSSIGTISDSRPQQNGFNVQNNFAEQYIVFFKHIKLRFFGIPSNHPLTATKRIDVIDRNWYTRMHRPHRRRKNVVISYVKNEPLRFLHSLIRPDRKDSSYSLWSGYCLQSGYRWQSSTLFCRPRMMCRITATTVATSPNGVCSKRNCDVHACNQTPGCRHIDSEELCRLGLLQVIIRLNTTTPSQSIRSEYVLLPKLRLPWLQKEPLWLEDVTYNRSPSWHHCILSWSMHEKIQLTYGAQRHSAIKSGPHLFDDIRLTEDDMRWRCSQLIDGSI